MISVTRSASTPNVSASSASRNSPEAPIVEPVRSMTSSMVPLPVAPSPMITSVIPSRLVSGAPLISRYSSSSLPGMSMRISFSTMPPPAWAALAATRTPPRSVVPIQVLVVISTSSAGIGIVARRDRRDAAMPRGTTADRPAARATGRSLPGPEPMRFPDPLKGSRCRFCRS
ncbi:MAG: hypothetical protein ACYTJ0_21615 [Planctomycetota bacterium]